ncbi:hypothetical protein AXF42_Ash009398 [Apostasia shenzhenica]|uniref:Retrotransposon gag domain-containing protein n=1 Tax=Apostasia shenzhenica TaxID=1088818 RepID=A0A2I0B3Z7_9ASPA|nr:hypothetical protein AXF42_Ash009398 [Apostasia shenzhenica]
MKAFQDGRPPLFKGMVDPFEAENWLARIEKIFWSMNCPEDKKVALATFALDGEAEIWWQGVKRFTFFGRHETITWKDFEEVFLRKFFRSR